MTPFSVFPSESLRSLSRFPYAVTSIDPHQSMENALGSVPPVTARATHSGVYPLTSGDVGGVVFSGAIIGLGALPRVGVVRTIKPPAILTAAARRKR